MSEGQKVTICCILILKKIHFNLVKVSSGDSSLKQFNLNKITSHFENKDNVLKVFKIYAFYDLNSEIQRFK